MEVRSAEVNRELQESRAYILGAEGVDHRIPIQERGWPEPETLSEVPLMKTREIQLVREL